MGEHISEDIRIKRGSQEACILQPLLLYIYSNKTFEKALEHCNEGISINGVNINDVRYADDSHLRGFFGDPADATKSSRGTIVQTLVYNY